MAMTEHLWSVSGSPLLAHVVGNKIIVVSSSGSEFSVIDLSIPSSFRYTSTPGYGDTYYGIIGDEIWSLYRWLGPGGWGYWKYIKYLTNGSVVEVENSALGESWGGIPNPPFFKFGNYVVPFSGKIYSMSSKDYPASMPVGGSPGAVGEKLYVANGTKIKKIDQTTWSVAGSTINILNSIYNTYPGITIGNNIYWPSAVGLSGVNTTNDSPIDIVCTPSGIPDAVTKYIVGSDGYLYRINNNDNLIVVNPETGQWKSVFLGSSRGTRKAIASSLGKLWIPSGKPDTWV